MIVMAFPKPRARRRPASALLQAALVLLLLLPARTDAAPRWWDAARKAREDMRPSRIPALIEGNLRVLDGRKSIRLAGERIVRRKALTEFYSRRGYRPAWIVRGGQAVPAAWQLLDAIGKSRIDGLEPGDYHGPALDSLIEPFGRRFDWDPAVSPESAAALDILLTDAYLRLASDLLKGRVSPVGQRAAWHASPERPDLAAHLDKALERHGKVRESLDALAPTGREYGIMKYWLAEYREIEKRGGWPDIPPGAPLGPGSQGRRVALLCARLEAERRLEAGACGDRYDSTLALAVGRYQARQGLAITGIADTATLRELNIPVEERIRQILLNLECWRWLPRDLGTRHVRVNIADFSLVAWEDGRPGPAMRVVVGTLEDSTPVLSDFITAVTLNPPWYVPDSIAAWEFLPAIRKDPAFLEQSGMELMSRLKTDTVPILPDTVDWDDVDPDRFPFRIRQKPGAGSPLGRFKFVLTNPFQIYLHDTPGKVYFKSAWRALSHGCVRLEKPEDLALWLLRADWTREGLEREIARQETRSFRVAGGGIPVHILYWTAFCDPAGGLQFRQDIYGWDRKMSAELRKRTIGL